MPALNIQSCSKDVEDILSRLCALLLQSGAWFYKDLQIKEEKGDLSLVDASFSAKRKSFLRIPVTLMPRIRDYRFALNGGQITCEKRDKDRHPIRDEVMQCMCDLYNATDKLAKWRDDSPFLSLPAKNEVLALLLQARERRPKVRAYMDMLTSEYTDELILKTFLGSRAFSLNHDYLDPEEQNSTSESEDVLLPIIDLCNHHYAAEGYDINPGQRPYCMRVFGCPNTHSGEIFVRYNQYDALDTLLFYGFVDTEVPWLCSVPGDIHVDETLKIETRALGGTVKGVLPPQLRDLRLFIPQRLPSSTDDCLVVNRLLIPGLKAPRALQRVLAFLIQSARPDQSSDFLRKKVAECEQQVLNTNLNYWEKLHHAVERLDRSPMKDRLCVLCEQSMLHLRAYKPLS